MLKSEGFLAGKIPNLEGFFYPKKRSFLAEKSQVVADKKTKAPNQNQES